MTADQYIQSVIDHVPQGHPLQDQIAMDLRSHIAEGLESGQPLDAVLLRLGDPLLLAESYLSAVPLQSAAFLPRLAAKVIDVLLVAAIVGLVCVLLWYMLPDPARYFVPALSLGVCVLALAALTVISEYRAGRTPGKRVMGLRVVRESGARITLGQSLLRQLPFFAQFFAIDALFALFTTKHQRAFEMITRTRTVALLLVMGRMGGVG